MGAHLGEGAARRRGEPIGKVDLAELGVGGVALDAVGREPAQGAGLLDAVAAGRGRSHEGHGTKDAHPRFAR